MLTPGVKYVYEIHNFEVLATQVEGPGKSIAWLKEQLQTLGDKGELPVKIDEGYRASDMVVQTARGQQVVPYYTVTVLTAKAVPDKETK